MSLKKTVSFLKLVSSTAKVTSEELNYMLAFKVLILAAIMFLKTTVARPDQKTRHFIDKIT